MSDIQIEKGFFAVGPTQTESICWLAREILGGYMGMGESLLLGDEDEVLQRTDTDDEFDELENDVLVHETPMIAINHRQRASLSNLPYVIGETVSLVPIIDPGYVALRVEPNENPPIDARSHLHNGVVQVIFRQSNPATEEDAAIFEGFSLDDNAKIPEDKRNKLEHIEYVLRSLQTGYRLMLQSDSHQFTASYLSVVPRAPISDDQIFEELFRDR